jgi:hypothetical protein
MAKKDNMKGQFCEDLGDWRSYLKDYQFRRTHLNWK